VSLERVTQDGAVFAQELRVAFTVLVQQPRLAFDVREEERDRAGRELTHDSILKLAE